MIVIYGMEMPKNCNYCRFNYDRLCHAAMQSFAGRTVEENGRLKDCPLMEVNTFEYTKPVTESATDYDRINIE